jgi:TP901 family phage tail tape measure protein
MGRRGIRAGAAYVELYADNNKLSRGLKSAGVKLKAFGRSVGKTGRELVKMSASIAVPVAFAVRTFAGFTDEMAKVQAVTQATDAEFKKLTDTAKTLGRTTSFTAAEVGGAMTELGRAGFKPTQILDSIDAVLDLARATSTELPRAAEISAAAMRGFGLEASESRRIADLLTATANNSAQGLEDIGESMKYVAPLAKEAGATIEDTAAALGVLANNGIKGSMAGTALGRAYKNLAKSAPQKVLEGVGVKALDASGNLRKVSTVLAELGEATKELGSGERLGIFEEVFGRGSAAALKLASGSDFKDMVDVLDDIQGTAKKTAETMDKTLGGSFRKLFSSVEGVQIAIGEALAPEINALAEYLTKTGGEVTKWIAENKDLVVTILKVVAVVAAVGVALVALGSILGLLGTLFTVVAGTVGALGAAMTFLIAHPVIAVLAAIAIAAIAVSAAFMKANKGAAKLATKYAELTKAGDNARATDRLRMQRLEQLAKVEDKNAKQIKESSTLIATLTGRYGDLGLSIDKTTGKISGMTEAQGKLAKAQRKAALAQVDFELFENLENSGALTDEGQNGDKYWTKAGAAAASEDLARRTRINTKRFGALQARRRAILAGDSDAVVGEGKSDDDKLRVALAKGKADRETKANGPNVLARKKAADDAADAIKALADLDEAAADRARTDLEKKIHLIRQETKERQRLIALLVKGEQMRKGGPRADVLAKLKQQSGDTQIRGIYAEADAKKKAAADAAEKIAKKAKAKRDEQLDAEKTLAQDVARLKIEANLKGHKKTMALIDLEEKQAIAAAKLDGVGVGLVKQKYDLRRQIAEAGQQVADSRSVSNVGMFRTGGRLGDLSGGDMAQRQTKAAEKGAKNLDKLVAMAENGDLAIATV